MKTNQDIVEELLPEFAKACAQKETDTVILYQSAFAAHEHCLLGAAVQYAGHKKKTIIISPK